MLQGTVEPETDRKYIDDLKEYIIKEAQYIEKINSYKYESERKEN